MGRSAALSAVAAHHSNPALDAACLKAGSPTALAEAIGVAHHVVVSWIGGALIPADVCPAIEQATGSTCDTLRPDLLWVRDGAGEVLAYTVPVDGADAAYVRQAIACSPRDSACEVADTSVATQPAAFLTTGTLEDITTAALEAVRAIRSAKDHFARGRIVPGPDATEGWNPWAETGPLGTLSAAGSKLEEVTGDVLIAVHRAETAKSDAPPYRNPLMATALPENAGDERTTMTAVDWLPAASTTVERCLDEATIMLRNACQLILTNNYQDSEDAMSLFLGVAQTAVRSAHSKLLQFNIETRP